jgi:leucyl-tRNA synthetase
VGGAEHAVLHLLYARFWHKVLYDLGYVHTSEPFMRLVNQGMILGENGEKMSKSRGNVVNPDDIIRDWGADAMRLYEMFMGPLEVTKPWQTNGIAGMSRFLNRVWRLFVDEQTGEIAPVVGGEDSDTLARSLHRTIRKVTEDTEGLRFNTAISAMIEFTNTAYKEENISREAAEWFVLLLSPYAPHMCEELWERLGREGTLAWEPWPQYDPELVREEMITLSIQVNGRMRGSIDVAVGATEAEVLEAARAVENVQKHLEGKQLRKEVYVPGRIVNFVVSG